MRRKDLKGLLNMPRKVPKNHLTTANYLARNRGQNSVVQPHLTTAENATNIKVTDVEVRTALETLRKFTKQKRSETLSTAVGKAQKLLMKLQYMKRGLDYDLNFNHIINGNYILRIYIYLVLILRMIFS